MPGPFDFSGDPHGPGVMRAQSHVANRHPGGDIRDLLAVNEYVAGLELAERVSLKGCFKAWWFGRPPEGVVVNWAGKEWSPEGMALELAGVGTVYPYDPPVTWSAFDQEKNALEVAAPTGRPLSHRLLLIHEVAHKITTPRSNTLPHG